MRYKKINGIKFILKENHVLVLSDAERQKTKIFIKTNSMRGLKSEILEILYYFILSFIYF